MIRNEDGLFHVLSKILQESEKPLTCVEMFDFPKVREQATTSNRVSDYLGNLWRKGLVVRLPAPRTNNSSARWMYEWKKQRKAHHAAQVPVEYSAGPAPKNGRGASILSKPGIEITDDGKVTVIDLPHMTITIRQK